MQALCVCHTITPHEGTFHSACTSSFDWDRISSNQIIIDHNNTISQSVHKVISSSTSLFNKSSRIVPVTININIYPTSSGASSPSVWAPPLTVPPTSWWSMLWWWVGDVGGARLRVVLLSEWCTREMFLLIDMMMEMSRRERGHVLIRGREWLRRWREWLRRWRE